MSCVAETIANHTHSLGDILEKSNPIEDRLTTINSTIIGITGKTFFNDSNYKI